MKNSFFLLIIALFFACQTTPPKPIAPVTYDSDTTSIVQTENKASLDFSYVVDVDSAEWLAYPLSIGGYGGRVEEYKDYLSSGISKNSNHPFYWNILFYNTKTQESHGLDTMKMVIHEFSAENKAHGKTANQFCFYEITKLDSNKDGLLDEKDPQYLFVSNKAGKNLKQITPNDTKVLTWSFPRKSDFMLIRVIKDSNRDGVFDLLMDNESLMRVDFKPEPTMAYEVFPQKLKQEMQALADKQWKKKKE